MIEIKNTFNLAVIFKSKKATNMREAVEEALDKNVDLSDTDLRGADLRGAYLRGADLRGADLRGAYLRGADLRGAYLRGAYLHGADLHGADLRGADLRGADLRDTDLRGADLRGAKNLNKYLTTSLYFLKFQVNPIRAFKIVNEIMEGPFNGGVKYEIGKTIKINISECNANEQEECGAGINLATLDWCLKNKQPHHKIIICEFNPKDIVAIPIGSGGKFRVSKCKVIEEWKPLPEAGKEKEE